MPIPSTAEDYPVVCHRCVGAREIMRSQARLIGSAQFGGLWHCIEHEDCETCPHGAWTEPTVAQRAERLAAELAHPMIGECGHALAPVERFRAGTDHWCGVCMRWVNRRAAGVASEGGRGHGE